MYIRGGIYDHSDDADLTAIMFWSNSGAPDSPIVASNFPGEVPTIYSSGTFQAAVDMRNVSWIKVFGLIISNAARSFLAQHITNCEFGSITVTGVGTGSAGNAYSSDGMSFYNGCISNYIHNCLVYNVKHNPNSDSGGCIAFGGFYDATDFTSYNLIESNECYWAGHEALGIYGRHNLIRGNWSHNSPFCWRNDSQKTSAARNGEMGGQMGSYNVFEDNRMTHAGITPSFGSHGIEVEGSYNIFRRNYFLNNEFSGLRFYGGKLGGPSYDSPTGDAINNYVYNNTLAFNGFGPITQTNYNLSAMDDETTLPTPTNYVLSASELTNAAYISSIRDGWGIPVTYALSFAHTQNTVCKNNLLWGNCINGVNVSLTDPSIAVWANNLTNSDPLFLDSTDGGPFSRTLPNCALRSGSPAIDAGGFLTTITSASGSGMSFTVADPDYFFAGWGASAGHPVLGDLIQLQGQQTTARITAISGNQLTVDSAMTWTNGQGVGLPYSGRAPDVGAYERPRQMMIIEVR
jgi:hypothetical protein